MNIPIYQLAIANNLIGIAKGALETAAAYTGSTTRSWLHSSYERAADEPYVLDPYGDLASQLWEVEAFADRVAEEAQDFHEHPGRLTERVRGEHAVRVSAVKVRAAGVALDVTSRIFEVMGARSTTSKLVLDRFWRNARTLTLHDPIAYKRREVGVLLLRDEIPEPTWYT